MPAKAVAPKSLLEDNTTWCHNPQIFLSLKKPGTTMKIVAERVMGRKREKEVQIGCTVGGFVCGGRGEGGRRDRGIRKIPRGRGIRDRVRGILPPSFCGFCRRSRVQVGRN